MSEIILTPTQMREAESYAVDNGVLLETLMNNAGIELSNAVKAFKKKKVTIIAGSGNNGGDGYVCARELFNLGYDVSVILTDEPKTELSKNAFLKLPKGVKRYGVDDFYGALENVEVIVDAVFGTGFKGDLPQNVKKILRVCDKLDCVKIACDIPSGVDALRGTASEGTMKCDVTVCFHKKKLGAVLKPACEYCGEVKTSDIGIKNYEPERPIIKTEINNIKEIFPKRASDSHKGTFGKLVSVCGSLNFSGAAALSTLAALRSGVGLVTLCTPKTVASNISRALFECTYLPLEQDENGFATFNSDDINKILNYTKTASAILVGCGLGNNENTFRVVRTLIESAECPLILDADGINSICPHIDVLKNTRAELILTPHPAELSRLTGLSLNEVLDNRLEISERFSKEYNVTLVSKGADTFITTPNETYLSSFGNTGLSKGGSGDTLAGLIASFAAQGAGTVNASRIGAFLLGFSAELVAKNVPERYMLATDVTNKLPEVFSLLEDA